VDEQDWDDGSVTLAQLNKQEASDRARLQSLGGIVRGGQLTSDTAANPEVLLFPMCSFIDSTWPCMHARKVVRRLCTSHCTQVIARVKARKKA